VAPAARAAAAGPTPSASRQAAVSARGIAARGCGFLDAIAHVVVVAARNRFVATQLHFEINHLVARIIELRLELRRQRRVAGARLRNVARGLVTDILETLDVRAGHGRLGAGRRSDAGRQDHCPEQSE
jgi:hypothetical protein